VSVAAPIYLDYAATTPVDPRVARLMTSVLEKGLGNPAANHASGAEASALIETARAQVAALIGARTNEIHFTSGATESNNLAIQGVMRAARSGAAHVITLSTEHKSVLEPVRVLGRQGVAISILNPDAQGRLSPEALREAMRPDTQLVTLLHVNNETGVAQDLEALKTVCAQRQVKLHIDASQSAGKLDLSLEGIDLLSFTAHKLGGPQGIGALYVADRCRGFIQAQIVGGGHERGLRAGTLATHQIAAFGLAAELARRNRESESMRIAALRDRLWQGLSTLPGVMLNGHPSARAPGILNVSFAGVEGESLFTSLPGLILSTGSACNSRSAEPSYVLRALGRDTQLAQSSLRFSLGRGTTEAQIDAALVAIRQVHEKLWAQSPARPVPAATAGQRLVGEAGAASLGTWVRFALNLQTGTVKDARVQVYGCPHTVAACHEVARRLAGQVPGQFAVGTPDQWRVAVRAPIEKLGRMLIIEDALGAVAPA
jgi:cysteine desulfurase